MQLYYYTYFCCQLRRVFIIKKVYPSSETESLQIFRYLIQKVALKHQNSGPSPKFYVLEHTLFSSTVVKMLVPEMKNLKKDPCSEVKNTKWNIEIILKGLGEYFYATKHIWGNSCSDY